MDEAKESIGVAMMPALTEMIDYLNSEKGQKVITDFAEAFADAIKIMAKYLPGVVREVNKLVGKVAKQGLMAGLLSDPKIAIAAAAYGAGFIYGGPAGGAIAAVAAYAGAQGIQNVSTDTSADIVRGVGLSQVDTFGGLPKYSKETLKKIKEKQKNRKQVSLSDMLNDPELAAAYQEAQGIYGGGGRVDKPKFKMNSSRLTPTINIVVNGAADSRESARAIERTLQKLNLNGGSQAGILGFN